MKYNVKLGDKVTLMAAKLTVWLEAAIRDAVEEATVQGIPDSMSWARKRVVALFNEEARWGHVTKVTVSEDGKDAGRGRYHAVYNQARDCWDLMFRDVLCASFYVGRYPCAEDKVVAEVSRLNAEYGKEQE